MAIRKNGRFKGKLGNTVTYMLMNQEVERTIGVSTKAATIPQETNKEKMRIVNGFQKPVKEFLNIGFELEAKLRHTYGYCMATAFNILNAVKGCYPELEMDFEKVLVSKGIIPVNAEAKVEVKENGLEFSWDAALLEKGMMRNDQVMMLAYCPEKQSAFFETGGARRTKGEDFLELTAYHEPVILEVYLSFVAADRKSISNSIHIGQVKF